MASTPQAAARIGPNAITRAAEALRARRLADALAAVFGLAGLDTYLHAPPEHMVDEREVTRLHHAMLQVLGPQLYRNITRDAGERTGAYLLAQRIPRPVQGLLRRLPARPASALLVAAIRRHAWTFAGSAAFEAGGTHPVRFALRDCPLCRGARAQSPCCDFYAGCFERLFRELVHRQAKVHETACTAMGDAACRFEVNW